MIVGFKHKGLEKFFLTGSTAGIQPKHKKVLRLQLSALNDAVVVQDMNLPGWHLHELKGKRTSIWSVRVSGNWRLTFKFDDGDAELVNYEDYH